MDLPQLLLAIGFVLGGGFGLYIGGEALVRGASGLALIAGVSSRVAGLTVVAFGTSAPEMFVSVLAAGRGNPEIALGNIIGSNIANVGLILGTSALVLPVAVQRLTLRLEIPLLILASALLLVLGLDRGLGRVDGVLLLVLFAAFLWYCFRFRKEGAEEAPVEEGGKSRKGVWAGVLLVLAGLGGLALGADLFIRGAVTIAEMAGVSQLVIGLSLVALGTSLPELAASLVAAFRGKADIAVGNVIGSCLFNVLLIQGTVSLTHPVDVPLDAVRFDIPVMVGFAVVILPLASRKKRVGRLEGGIILAAYVAYIAVLAARG